MYQKTHKWLWWWIHFNRTQFDILMEKVWSSFPTVPFFLKLLMFCKCVHAETFCYFCCFLLSGGVSSVRNDVSIQSRDHEFKLRLDARNPLNTHKVNWPPWYYWVPIENCVKFKWINTCLSTIRTIDITCIQQKIWSTPFNQMLKRKGR